MSSLLKKCSKCKKSLALSEFYISKLNSEWLRPACKYCMTKDQRIYNRLRRRNNKINKSTYIIVIGIWIVIGLLAWLLIKYYG